MNIKSQMMVPNAPFIELKKYQRSKRLPFLKLVHKIIDKGLNVRHFGQTRPENNNTDNKKRMKGFYFMKYR